MNNLPHQSSSETTQGDTKIATFAGGCFWCVESAFENLSGVLEVISGYTGGDQPNPSYEDVAYGRTNHLEAVRIRFDPRQISYEDLLTVFWRQIDPTDSGGQFVDRGSHYRTAIFVHTEEQRRIAESSKADLESSQRFGGPLVTEIQDATEFYPAEEYHQDFFLKNPRRYKTYREGSGRDRFLKRIWAEKPHGHDAEKALSQSQGPKAEPKPEEQELKQKLSPLQYQVTQQNGTEPPFRNKYWDNHQAGIYVDIVSGEPLFSSLDKYESGTGWPSFTTPLVQENIVELEDREHGMVRTEVRSKQGNSHLGHVFPDGPDPRGQRYCINSAALRFVSRENLEREGYGHYTKLFQSE